MMFEILRSALIEFGVDVKNFKVDETGKMEFEIDFSEHDKKVTEEKDEKIERLEKAYHRHKSKICNLESENQCLKRNIEDLEAIIADGKKPDISVSENGVSIGCECGGYHLAKERIAELEDRHQSDCIRINQLLTTIDVLTERYQKLREVHGV